MYTPCILNIVGPLLFILSIEVSSESVEGSGCKQMMPKLENKAFSVKSTQYICLKHQKEPYNTLSEIYNRGIKQLAR